MNRILTVVVSALIALTSFVAPASATVYPVADPLPAPPRSSVHLITPLGQYGSGNAHESRPALSLIKLYMVDYALNRGDGRDWADAEAMVRASDDAAASRIWAKYGSISVTSPAGFYGLTSTRAGGTWGSSVTSAADAARFVQAKVNDPNSPIPGWMASAYPVAADGTRQNWGTAHIAGAQGTKWGWSDYGSTTVGSVTFGPGYVAASLTWGGPDTQTADVLGAIRPKGLFQAPPGLPKEAYTALYQLNSFSAG